MATNPSTPYRMGYENHLPSTRKIIGKMPRFASSPRAVFVLVLGVVVGAAAASATSPSSRSHPLSDDDEEDVFATTALGHPHPDASSSSARPGGWYRRALLEEETVGEVPDGVKESVEADLGFAGGSGSSGGGGGEGNGDGDGDGKGRVTSFDLAKMERTPLKTEPFKYLVVEQMIPPTRLKQILDDFPPALLSTALANKKNVEERDVRATGQVKGAYERLIKDAKSPEFRAAVGEKIGMDLSKAYTRITLRGACQPKPCGGIKSIHVDHHMKMVSILMYLNEDWPTGEAGEGGHLLLLKKPSRKGSDPFVDTNVYDEVKSYGGNMVLFVNDRSPKANWVWHGLKDYKGLRRAIQINYCKTKTCN